MRKNGNLNFILTDHLGSTSLVTDANGAVISETKYKAWGETRYSSGTEQTKYTYTGQYSYASDFGLHFYNARWYDSSLSRFAQADSIIPLQSQGVQAWDRFAYTNNSPVNYTDPTGHDAWWCNKSSCLANWIDNQKKLANSRNVVHQSNTGNGSEFGLVFAGEGDDGDKSAFLIAVGLEANRHYDVYCSHQPANNCGYETPAELYAATHGTTTITFSNSSGSSFCERNANSGQEGVICWSNSSGKLDPILASHEMGHVFNAIISNNGYSTDDPYDDLVNERMTNPNFPALDVDIAPGHRNNCCTNGEDFANMYSMWVFDDWVDTHRRQFMEDNMYDWILQMLNP